jgi:hypothetical protein
VVDLVPPVDVRTALRSLFLHLFPADVEVAGDRVDVILVLLDTWDDLRTREGDDRDGHGHGWASSWARVHEGRGFAAARRLALGDVVEVPFDGQPDAIPARLADTLTGAILVEPSPERFGAAYRAALTLTWGVREWTAEVDALAGHLLLVHDVDARSHRGAGDDGFDLLERLWKIHLPFAELDVCVGEEIERELAAD